MVYQKIQVSNKYGLDRAFNLLILSSEEGIFELNMNKNQVSVGYPMHSSLNNYIFDF